MKKHLYPTLNTILKQMPESEQWKHAIQQTCKLSIRFFLIVLVLARYMSDESKSKDFN